MKTFVLHSSEFRKQFASLTEETVVTVNGHVIGMWTPLVATRPPVQPTVHPGNTVAGEGPGWNVQTSPSGTTSMRRDHGYEAFRPVPKPARRK